MAEATTPATTTAAATPATTDEEAQPSLDIRKHLVEYDDVVNKQREVIYEQRSMVLNGADLKANIQEMIGSEVSGVVAGALVGDPGDWAVSTAAGMAALVVKFPLVNGFLRRVGLSCPRSVADFAELWRLESERLLDE